MKNWVVDYIKKYKKNPRRAETIYEGKLFLNNGTKPSKGWCDKFIKRNI